MKSSKSTQTTNSSSQSDPWDVTIPYLTSFLGDLDMSKAIIGPTGDQLDAFQILKDRAASGNPYAGQIDQLARDQFGGVGSRSGTVDAAYSDLKNQLGGYARGDNLDFENNPYIQKMLSTVGDNVQNRIAGMFAGAGRNVTGNAAGQRAIAEGVTSAQLPILSDLYSREQQNQINAANALYGAGTSAATTGQSLDANSLASRAGAIDTADKAMAARDYDANAILNLDQQLKGIPAQDLASYASLLLPVAGLGGQQQGTSTTTGKSSGFSITAGDIMKLGSAVASDERVKQNIERVGETDDGQPIYRYQYKGDDTWHVGLMAQEVEKDHPEAVSEIGGVKHVNYKKATDDAVKKGSK